MLIFNLHSVSSPVRRHICFNETKFLVLIIFIFFRDKSWIKEEKMEAFLAVSQGSHEAPYFLHVEYKHPDSKMSNPIAVVGKGITFDT